MGHKGPNLYRNRCRKLSAENSTLRRIITEARRLIGFMTNEKIAEAARLLDSVHLSDEQEDVQSKHVPVEAMRWTGRNTTALLHWMFPDLPPDATAFDGTVNTLEGELGASKGDLIIRGIKGEFYPCKEIEESPIADPLTAPIEDVRAELKRLGIDTRKAEQILRLRIQNHKLLRQLTEAKEERDRYKRPIGRIAQAGREFAGHLHAGGIDATGSAAKEFLKIACEIASEFPGESEPQSQQEDSHA